MSRPILAPWSALLVVLAACGSGAAPPPPAAEQPAAVQPGAAQPTAAEQPASPPAATTSSAAPAAAAGGLPDLAVGLEHGLCERGPGNEGADSHFLGEFKVSGTTVSGTERWLLAANSKLQASPRWTSGEGCEVRWMLTGAVTPPQHCGDCDLGLQLTANVDLTGSTCPEDLVKREKSFTVRYDVRRGADGVAWVYFGNSGKLLGQGYHQGDRFNYVSQHQCKWF